MAVISKTGLNQGDLVDFLSATMTAINEIRSDHGSFREAIANIGSMYISLWSCVRSMISCISAVDSLANSKSIVAPTVSLTASANPPAAISASALTFTIT